MKYKQSSMVTMDPSPKTIELRANKVKVGKRLHSGQVAHPAGAYPGFCSMKRLRVFLLPTGWDASPSQGYPPERGTVRVKCLAQEHNTMSPARARTRSARSGVERANHEATAPPINIVESNANFSPVTVINPGNTGGQSSALCQTLNKIQ